jgi:hypothetical protein
MVRNSLALLVTMGACVCVAPAEAVTVDVQLDSPIPTHYFVSDDEDLGDYAFTFWRIAPVDFPALVGQTGMLTIRLNAPPGQRFITTVPGTDLQVYGTWSQQNVLYPGLVFEPAPIFSGAPMPASLDQSYVLFGPLDPDVSPNELARVTMVNTFSDIPEGFYFSSFEVSVPIDQVLSRFPRAGDIPFFEQCFCFSIIGDVPMSAQQGPFVLLVPIPEPKTDLTVIIGVGFALHLRRRCKVAT